MAISLSNGKVPLKWKGPSKNGNFPKKNGKVPLKWKGPSKNGNFPIKKWQGPFKMERSL